MTVIKVLVAGTLSTGHAMLDCSAGLLAVTLACSQFAYGQSESASLIVARAAALDRAHQMQQAEALLLELLAHYPEDSEALTGLSQIRVEQNRQDEAAALLTQALRARPSSIPANQAFGELLLAKHHYPEAMDRFETVLAGTPTNTAARAGERDAAVRLALDNRHAGHEDAALACLEHAVEHLPDDAVLLTDLGIEAERLQQLPRASEALTQALTLAPKDPAALYALARVEIDQQHLTSAEEHLRAYLSMKPEDASAHFGLGRLLAMQLRTGEAEQELRRSIALQPEQTESVYQLGQIELDAGYAALAQPLFAKVIERDPHHSGALTGLGVIAYRAKDYFRAERYLVTAVEYGPEYQPARYYYGLTLSRQGKTAAAQVELKRAAELSREVHGAPSTQMTPGK